MPKILQEELQALSKYIRSISGIHLDESKMYLIENRLGGLLKDLGCSSYSELYFKAKTDPTLTVQKKIIDMITTGETLFFRDSSTFELLKNKILPDLIDKRRKQTGNVSPTSIRIWSTACSSGQETYSIAIALKEVLVDLSKYNIKLLGSDISDAAITRASLGMYTKFEIERGLPQEKLTKYFTSHNGGWKINEELRSLATFRKINLMDDFIGIGKFDIIFCRNVAIYFTEEDKIKLFKKIETILEPDGYLIVGATESLSGICPQFEPQRYVRSIFYQKRLP